MTDSLVAKYDTLLRMTFDFGMDTNTLRCDEWQLDYLLGALQRGPECAVIVHDPHPIHRHIDVDVCWFRKGDK